MEKELELGLSFLIPNISIKYVSSDKSVLPIYENEVVIEIYKLQSCPDINLFMKAMTKKIDRSDVFKEQKYTTGICIMLLASKGYCVTSSVLKDIPDTFIERCWECLQVITFTTPNPLCGWMIETIGSRTPSKYSAMFCQRKLSSLVLKTIGNIIPDEATFQDLDIKVNNLSNPAYHRDDIMMQTMILHVKK